MKAITRKRLILANSLLIGLVLGIGCFNLYISNAISYLSDDPVTCTNCHIMAPQYQTWGRSSHREVATCNDCHVPQDNVIRKYFFKAKDGMNHAWKYTLRLEPQVIQIKDASKKVVQENCYRCHSQQIVDPKTAATVPCIENNFNERVCWDCHREVPHGRVNSLSSVPNARVPLPESPVPSWLNNLMNY